MLKGHRMPVYMLVKPTVQLFEIAKQQRMLRDVKLKIPPMPKSITMNSMTIPPVSWCLIYRIFSQRGGCIKAYNNHIYDNNFRNFAKAGSFGTSWGVGNASPGSGVIILATSDVEIYNNKIENNNSSAITIASGFTVDDKAAEKINENYSPIPTQIKIHGNTISMGKEFPKPAYEHRVGQLIIATEQQLNAMHPDRTNKRIPAILYDGVTSNIMSQGTDPNPDKLCINQPGENMFVNADFANVKNPANWKPNTNMDPFACK